jgi:hypothetical protein
MSAFDAVDDSQLTSAVGQPLADTDVPADPGAVDSYSDWLMTLMRQAKTPPRCGVRF